MIHPVFKKEWRTQNRTKRRIYSKYMGWLEKGGYVFVLILFGLFAAAFAYKVDDKITADGVEIKAASTPLMAKEPTLVVKMLSEDFDAVQQGEALVQVVSGEKAIRDYRLWQAYSESRAAGDAGVSGLSMTEPVSQVLNAEAAGTFISTAKEGDVVEAEEEIGKILDYNDIRVEAKLKGQMVGNGKVGQVAELSSISIEADGDTILRGHMESGSERAAMLSRGVVGTKVKDALESKLKGSVVNVRDDIPLEITEVSGIEVDTDVKARPDTVTGAEPLDPTAEFRLKGAVIEGSHKAEVQIGSLPLEAQDAAREAVRAALKGKNVADADGKIFALEDPIDPKFVVKVKATAAGGANAQGLKASSLSRSYDAVIRLENPPKFLIQRLMQADKAGKKITAKVEVTTSQRPVALILLRRS